MKFLKKTLLFLLLPVVLTTAGIYFYLLSLKPDYSGTISLEGLSSQVEIYFDKYGIPHIYGESEEDVYFSLGYVHAQERLFQMEIIRRLGSGRLSEILGDDMVQVDKFFRTIGIPEASKKSAAAYLSSDSLPYQKAALAYIAGINQYIEKGKTPIEFTLFGIKKEKFNPVDLYYIGGYLSFSFSEILKTDPVLAAIKENLGDVYLDCLGLNLKSGNISDSSYKSSKHAVRAMDGIAGIMEMVPVRPWIGSNAWVIAPSKTTSGKVLFANDTHINFSQPSVWYEAHLNYPGYSFYGNFLAGFPFALTGHNLNAAWGLTLLKNDDIDLFREKLNPDDSTSALFMGHWEKMQFRKETIKVKNSEDVVFEVRTTRHGPLISDVSMELREGFAEPLSFWWIFNQAPNRGLQAFYAFAHCGEIESGREAASMIDSPGLNILYGDAKGNIAWWTAAKLVKRPEHVISKTILDGTGGRDEHTGYHDFEKNPYSENPASGFLFSSNNLPDGFDEDIFPGYYAPENRSVRILRFLDRDQKFSTGDMKELLLDDVSETHSSLAKTIAGIVEASGKKFNQLQSNSLGILKQWDGSHGVNDAGPVVFNKILAHILYETMHDELGEDHFNSLQTTNFLKNSLGLLLNNEDAVWWNNIRTDKKETRSEIIVKSFLSGIEELESQLGKDIGKWKWGKVHLLEHVHVLGRKQPLNFLFNLGPYQVPGGNETVNNSGFSLTRKGIYKVHYGPAMRRIIDFNDLGNSLSINPTGQSGYFFGPHYSDQSEMFNKGIFRKQMMDKNEILNECQMILTLIPASASAQ